MFKIFFLIIFALTCSFKTYAETPDSFVVVPHVYEFDKTENPNRYYWCGHAALSSVIQSEVGVYKSLKDIHDIFLKNSPGGYAKKQRCGDLYCASLLDLKWAASLQQNGGFGLSKTVMQSVDRTSSALLNKVKDAIKFGHAVIVPSTYLYPVGHFWVIVGYKDTGNPDQSILFMRDSASSNPGDNWEEEVKVGSFVYNTNHGGKIDLLIVKN